jgi:hypothetical protein
VLADRGLLIAEYRKHIHLGQTKVENFDVLAVDDENIPRFDVAVNDALAMGSVQPVSYLKGKIYQGFNLKWMSMDDFP